MALLLRMTALCVVASALGLLLKKDVPALQLLLTLGTAAVLGTAVLELAGQATALGREFSAATGIDGSYLALTLKCAAIAVVVRLGGDLCRDAGQTALASLIEITGTFSAAALAAPLLRTLLESVWGAL